MNPILYLIYQFAKLLVKIVDRIFFSKTIVRNREGLKIKKTTIVISNHPNTLLDPLVIAERINTTFSFLVNASLFKNPVGGWILGHLYCIPVERPKDVDGRRIQNDDAFEKADKYLTGGGVLYIAVEGTSAVERRIRKIKTGAARIALSAEVQNDFKLGLEILPVGLTYSDQISFREQLFINVGEGIDIDEYKSLNEKDHVEAVRKLTHEIEKRLTDLTIVTRDDDEDELIKKMEAICQTNNRLPFDQVFDRTKKLIEGWRFFQENDSEAASDFSKKINSYFSVLQKNKTPDHVAIKIPQNDFQQKWWMRTIFMILSFPVFIYGWTNNFLANYLPALANRKAGLYIGYSSMVKCILGLFTYPIFYGLQIWLFQKYIGGGWMVWVYFTSIILTGLFAWWYKDFAKDTLSGWRFQNYFQKNKTEGELTFEFRKSVVVEIEKLLSKNKYSDRIEHG